MTAKEKPPAPAATGARGRGEDRAGGLRIDVGEHSTTGGGRHWMTVAEFDAEQQTLRTAKLPTARKTPKTIPIAKTFHYRSGKRVHVYEGRGVLVESLHPHCPNPDGNRRGGGKRGAIAGWSAASRKRCRELLLTSAPPDGYTTYGVTYTIPGPVAPIEEQRDLWSRYSRQLAKWGWLLVWRLEVQARGAWHWHGILSLPPGLVTVGWRGASFPVGGPTAIQLSWFSALDGMGLVEGVTCNGTAYGPCPRSACPGAVKSAVDVSAESTIRSNWLRYLADHATKSKQEQIGVGIGRHWGVVGRKHLRELPPSSVEGLTDCQSWDYLRARQRLSTPRITDPSAPFGRRLGKRNGRGRVGRAVWFGDVQTDRRLVEWARSLHGSEALSDQTGGLRGGGGWHPLNETRA